MFRILRGLLLLLVCMTGQAATPLPLTLLVEFSPAQAKAYQLQMQHWNLLQQAASAQVDVRVEHVSLQRSLDLVHQSGYCVFNKLKTPEREAQLLFSQRPLSISASQRLIQLQTPGSSQPNSIDLRLTLQSKPAMKIGIAAGRSYGPTIDALISEFPQQFYAISGEDVHVKLWQMLQRGRVDALIDYKARIDLLQAQQDLSAKATAVTASPIAHQPMFVQGFIACNKGPHGKAVMAVLDQVMTQPQLQQQLVQSFQQYFPANEWRQLQAQLQALYPAWSPQQH